MIILGLGSNIESREGFLQQAIDALSKEALTNITCSALYESPAVLLPGAPKEWDTPFLNLAVSGETTLGPQALLTTIKQIEQQIGRIDRGRWSPREIDIDILAYHDHAITEEHLTIPHPELTNRDFALLPLQELDPRWKHPVLQKEIEKLVKELQSITIEKTTITLSV